jgi:hypothetical protein
VIIFVDIASIVVLKVFDKTTNVLNTKESRIKYLEDTRCEVSDLSGWADFAIKLHQTYPKEADKLWAVNRTVSLFSHFEDRFEIKQFPFLWHRNIFP